MRASYSQVRHLKALAYFSMAANALTLTSFAFIWYYMFVDFAPSEDAKAFGDVVDYPLFFGIAIFATSAIYVVVPLENAMRTPKAFTRPLGIINVAFLLTLIAYGLMGLGGYLKYGSDIKQSITLNLPKDEMY